MKDHLAIGFQCRDLAAMVKMKAHIDTDALYRDIVTYNLICIERRASKRRNSSTRMNSKDHSIKDKTDMKVVKAAIKELRAQAVVF